MPMLRVAFEIILLHLSIIWEKMTLVEIEPVTSRSWVSALTARPRFSPFLLCTFFVAQYCLEDKLRVILFLFDHHFSFHFWIYNGTPISGVRISSQTRYPNVKSPDISAWMDIDACVRILSLQFSSLQRLYYVCLDIRYIDDNLNRRCCCCRCWNGGGSLLLTFKKDYETNSKVVLNDNS